MGYFLVFVFGALFGLNIPKSLRYHKLYKGIASWGNKRL